MVSGDTGYSFVWSNGATTQNLDSLDGGTYSVTVTSAGGCVDSATYTILGGSAVAKVESIQERVCPGDSTGFLEIRQLRLTIYQQELIV